MKLRIFLPATERPEAGARFAWMLFDAHHALLRQDVSTLAEIPPAEEVEAIVPASRVLFARLKLPRVNPATIRELLPFAVEDRLLADPSHIHAVAGRVNARGETVVAVLDREWLKAMLEALARYAMRPRKAWSEGALLASDGGEWNLVLAKHRGMLVDQDGVGVTFDRSASSAFLLALRIALDEASARGERPSAIRVHPERAEPLPDLATWAAEASMEFRSGAPWEKLAAGEPSAQAINLLQGDFAPRPTARLGHIPAGAIALALLIVGLELGFVALD
ncbi:MAG TPA: type II secretion system protein GspL, partial [Usitatibacter sp.]|nr:type II secretion system protein GspL [Usitatibacter sp.]